MYTVMIVEDEMLVRMGLMVSIPWKELGLRVVAEETNGTSAWEDYQKFHPDIVITDIRIPGLNGVELMEKIRSVDSTCAMVVITCVEEFGIVQKTIEMDVVSYLVKATMNQKDIVAAINKALRYLKSNNRAPSNMRFDGEVESVLTQYVIGRITEYDEVLQKCEGEIAVEIEGFIFLHLSKAGGVTDILRKSVQSILQDRLRSEDVMYLSNVQNGIMLLIRKQADEKMIEGVIDGIYNYCKNIFKLEIRFDICLSRMPVKILPDTVNVLVRDYGKDYLYDRGKLRVKNDGTIGEKVICDCFHTLRSNLWLLRNENSVAEIRDRIMRVEKEMCTSWVALCNASYFLAQYICKHAVGISDDALHVFGDLLANQVGLKAVFEGLNELIVNPALSGKNMRSEVGKAIQYMVKNQREEITLTRVAAEVGLHPTYLSKVFKNEVGLGFSDFMTIIRLDQATELLKNTNLSVQEISEECGFSDVSYFCRKFKAMMGCAPNIWRKYET